MLDSSHRYRQSDGNIAPEGASAVPKVARACAANILPAQLTTQLSNLGVLTLQYRTYSIPTVKKLGL